MYVDCFVGVVQSTNLWSCSLFGMYTLMYIGINYLGLEIWFVI